MKLSSPSFKQAAVKLRKEELPKLRAISLNTPQGSVYFSLRQHITPRCINIGFKPSKASVKPHNKKIEPSARLSASAEGYTWECNLKPSHSRIRKFRSFNLPVHRNLRQHIPRLKELVIAALIALCSKYQGVTAYKRNSNYQHTDKWAYCPHSLVKHLATEFPMEALNQLCLILKIEQSELPLPIQQSLMISCL